MSRDENQVVVLPQWITQHVARARGDAVHEAGFPNVFPGQPDHVALLQDLAFYAALVVASIKQWSTLMISRPNPTYA